MSICPKLDGIPLTSLELISSFFDGDTIYQKSANRFVMVNKKLHQTFHDSAEKWNTLYKSKLMAELHFVCCSADPIRKKYEEWNLLKYLLKPQFRPLNPAIYRSGLMIAAEDNDVRLAACLLDRKISRLNPKTRNDALIEAVKKNSLGVIARIIHSDLVSLDSSITDSALVTAAKRGHVQAMRLILDVGNEISVIARHNIFWSLTIRQTRVRLIRNPFIIRYRPQEFLEGSKVTQVIITIEIVAFWILVSRSLLFLCLR